MQPDLSPSTGPPAIKGLSPNGSAVCFSDNNKDDVGSETNTACSSMDSTGDSPLLKLREVSGENAEKQATCAKQPMLGSGRGSAELNRFGFMEHMLSNGCRDQRAAHSGVDSGTNSCRIQCSPCSCSTVSPLSLFAAKTAEHCCHKGGAHPVHLAGTWHVGASVPQSNQLAVSKPKKQPHSPLQPSRPLLSLPLLRPLQQQQQQQLHHHHHHAQSEQYQRHRPLCRSYSQELQERHQPLHGHAQCQGTQAQFCCSRDSIVLKVGRALAAVSLSEASLAAGRVLDADAHEFLHDISMSVPSGPHRSSRPHPSMR